MIDRMLAWFALTSSVLLLATQTAAADAPSLHGRVDDRAGMLSEAAQRLLRDDLVALERKTGHQFALLTLESLETDLEQYARSVVESSKLGRASGGDDGLLLLIVKQGNIAGLHIGRDLNAAIPEETALTQLREDLHPAIKRGAAVEGIFIVFQRWINAVGGLGGREATAPAIGTPDAPLPDSPELKAAVAEKAARRAERAGAVEFTVPAMRGPVNDHAGLLSQSERTRLEGELRSFRAEAGPQFALLSVRTLEGLSVEDYAMKVVETWQLGRAGIDDGLLLLVAREDRKLRIEVGYGLEGVVPDAVAARVVHDTLEPAFKRGQFAKGIAEAFRALMHAVDGREHGPPPRHAASSTSWESQRRSDALTGTAIITLLLTFVGLVMVIGFVRFWRGEGVFFGLYFDENRRLRLAQFRGGSSSGGSDAHTSWGSSSSSDSGSGSDDSGGGGRFGGGGASGEW